VFSSREALDVVVAGLRDREHRLRDAKAALADLQARRPGKVSYKGLLPALRRGLEDWRGLLHGDVAETRRLLRMLFTGRLVLTPRLEPAGRWYEFSAPTRYASLLRGIVPMATGSVAGSGAKPASVVIVDVRLRVAEEDQNRVLVELRAADGDRRGGDELIGLAVEFEEANLGHAVTTLPLEQGDLRDRDVDDRGLEGRNPEQILIGVGSEDTRESLDLQIG